MKHQQTFVLKAMMDISDIRSQAQNIQNVLSKVKLPVEQTSKFKTLFVDLEKDLDKYQKALNSGFKTNKDLNNLEKIGKNIEHTFQLIAKESGKFSGENFNKIFANFTGYSEQTKQLEKDLLILQNQLKNTLSNLSSGKNSSSFLKESGAAIANFEQKVPRATQKISDLRKALNLINNGNIEEATKLIQKFGKSTSEAEKKNQSNASIYRSTYETLNSYLKAATQYTKNYKQQVELLNQKLAESKMTDFKNSGILELGNTTQEAAGNIRDFANETNNAAKETLDFNKDLDSIKNKITYFFSLSNAVTIFRNILNDAITTVKDLDAAMTETAVVTDFSVGDMWEQLPEYTKRANELGTTIQSAYEAATLYYQQGLDTNEVIAISNETLKMARIAGMDAAEATDMMTAALRGFNMELNETSATRINDVYSELAAITAADTEEIATAMTKTASIAANAGMEFETTAAFLSQIVETTREAPETAGTALKTVIARFQELKKDPSEIGEVDGEIVDANKIETALKTIDVALRDTSGQFRDLDDVFLDIAGKWDGLDTNTQRYIATIAAGSRQQSRFIAMMSDYGRTMELVNAANNSAGASERQFGKTMESLEAKMNQLKNAWDEFTMSIANSTIIKAGVDLLTNLITAVNKVTEVFGDAGSGVAKLSLLLMGLNKTPKIINNVAESLARIIKIDGPIFESDTILGNLTKDSKKELGKFSDVWEDGIKNIRDNLKQGFTKNKASKELLGSLDPSFISALSAEDLETQFPIENVKAYNAAKQAGIPIQQAMIALENAEIAAKVNDTIATDQNTAADIRNALGTEAGVVATTKSTVASAAKTTATWLETAAVNALGAAMGVLNFLTSKSILPFTILATAALGLAAAFKIIQANSPEAKLEKLRENTEKATKAAEESKKVYDDLVTSINNIKDIEDNFKNLTADSNEWKQALLKVNQEVLNLINKYPQLAKFLNTENLGNGFVRFSLGSKNGEDPYDSILKEQYDKVINAQNVVAFSQIKEIEGERKVLEGDGLSIKTRKQELQDQKRQLSYSSTPKSTATSTQADIDKQIHEIDEKIQQLDTETNLLSGQITAKKLEREALLQNTYSSYMQEIGTEYAKELGLIMLKTLPIDETDELVKVKKNGIKESGEELKELYKDIFGIEPAEELTNEEIKLAIAQAQAAQDLKKEAVKISDAANKLNLGENKQAVLGVFSGNISVEDYKKLGIKSKDITSTENLEEALGLDEGELKTFFKETGLSLQNFKNGLDSVEFTQRFKGANRETQQYLQGQYSSVAAGGKLDLSGLSLQQISSLKAAKRESDSFKEKLEEAKNTASTTLKSNRAEESEKYIKNYSASEGAELQNTLNKAGISQDGFEFIRQEIVDTTELAEKMGKKTKEQFFDRIAEDSIELGADLTKLYDIFSDNEEALNAKGTNEYAKAMSAVKDQVKELTGAEFTEEEISDNLELIKQAANGSASALEKLQEKAAHKLLLDLDIPKESIKGLEDEMAGFAAKEFKVGVSLDDEPMIQGLRNLVNNGEITQKEMNSILGNMGAVPTIEWIPFSESTYNKDGLLGKLLGLTGVQDVFRVPQISYKSTGKTVTNRAAKTAGGYASSKSSSGGGSSKKDPWENSLDKYYNLLEDINEELRIREKLEREFSKITEDGISNSKAVLDNLAKQEKSLKRQKKLQKQLLSGRKSEMKSTLKENSKYSKYATYNWDDKTIEINWSAIDKVKDTDKGEAIEEYISELERIQESMDEASDAIADIDKDLKELKETGKDDYETLEEKILDAYIHNIEAQIDNLENTYEAMSQATSDIMNKMQDRLSEERQARENQETEENISETERRLAYLRQDTSGANDLEILQLEKQLEEQKEDYTDTLIEQKIDELKRQNSLAETQREEQIKLMKAQVAYAEKNGLYWDEIKALLAEGVTSKGGLKSGSTLDKLLKEDAGFAGMSEFQQKAWQQEMANTFEGADVYSQNNLGETLGGGLTPKQETEQKLKEAKKAKKVSALNSEGKSKKTLKYDSKLGWNDGTYTYSLTWDADKDRYVYSNKQKIKTSNANGYIASLPSSTKLSKSQIKKLQGGLNRLLKDKKLSGFDKLDTDGIIGPKTTAAIKKLQKKIGVAADGIWGPNTAAAFKKSSLKKYRTGGIADFTGPAWLDGTPSKPELVLNARDTENFIQLKNVLSDLMSDSVNAGNGGDNYYEIHIEVDEIANDYDVEKLATKVKKIIANDGMYRNVNTINMLR